MNHQSEHLSSAQVEEYGSKASGAGPETEEWVEKHLADCPTCRSRVLEFQRIQFALLADPKVNTVPTSDCPSEDDLRHLAAGICPESTAQKLTAHASACTHCGPLLREYTEDFSGNFTPEQQTILDELSSASPQWQRQKAREMLQQVRPAPPSRPELFPWIFPWKWIMVPAAAAVAFIAVGLWYLQRDTPERAEGLVAQAYTAQRTTEMRWPGAEWGPVREARGADQSRFSQPDALRRAAKIVNRHNTAASNNLAAGRATAQDLAWLRANAEVAMLEGNPERALDILSQTPESGPFLLDRAMAYFQLGRRLRSREHIERSISNLEKLLQNDPENHEALFNLGVAYMEIASWNQASAVWRQYLQLDQEGRWAAEAKEKLGLSDSMMRR